MVMTNVFKKGVAVGLVALQVWQPVLADVVISSAQVTQGQAANGVPLVNIAAPGASGISQNSYTRFDVDSSGLIFNNSAQPANTQLGGFIPGNANLAQGSARLILNEISGSLPSQLNGYMEVAGQKADVVIANPAGITCNGCGFINTGKGTLAAGTTLFGSDGSLSGFRVEDGRLHIAGAGLNASNTDRLNLYGRALVLNAELHARDLQVVTGANTINAATGVATPLGTTTGEPAFAIDSSSLGGMYANRIRLVGTEAGLGMRLAAPVAAMNGNLEITNNGDVRLVRASATQAASIRTQGDLHINNDGNAGQGGVSAGTALTLAATGDLAIGEGTDLTGAATTISAASVNTAATSGIAARRGLTITADVQHLQGTIASQGSITLDGMLVENIGVVAATAGMNVTADTLINRGTVSSNGGISRMLLTDVLDNDNGLMQLGGDLQISADRITNIQASLAAEGLLAISSNTAIDNTGGVLQGNGGINLSALGLGNVGGEVVGNSDITLVLASGGLDNTDGLIETLGSASLHNTGSLLNSNGVVRTGANLLLDLPSFNRSISAGLFSAQGMLSIATIGNIEFAGEALKTPGELELSSASGDVVIGSRIEAGSNITVSADQFKLGPDAFIAAQGTFASTSNGLENSGLVYGKNGVTLHVDGALVNGIPDSLADASLYHAAYIISEGDIALSNSSGGRMTSLHNYGGQIESLLGNITIKADDIQNLNIGWFEKIPTAADISSTYEYSISQYSFDTFHYCCGRSGEDTYTNRIETRVTPHKFGSLGHAGRMIAAGDISIETDALLNDHSIVSAGGKLDIVASSITNRGTILTDEITKIKIIRWHICEYDMWDLDCWGEQFGPYTSYHLGEQSVLPGILEGQLDVDLHGTVVNGDPAVTGATATIDEGVFEGLALNPSDVPPASNINLGIVDPTTFPGFHLPGNGLFTMAPPGHPYLIETDPALNTYDGFLGSGYLLEHLDWAPDITQRRLGDSYYEMVLIREALLASIGTRFIFPGITDEREQYEYLMANAIAASESLHLTAGISLSREQIDALQQDMVWLEERVIAGEQVLVPVVYLAQGSSRLLDDGAVIAGGTVTIDGSSISNAGRIQARDSLRISSTGDIRNAGGSLLAGEDLTLESGADITNESGHIRGENVLLQAEGDITHRTMSWQDTAGDAANGTWSTRVGDIASVEARGTQLQIAGGDIQVTAGALSGTDVGLAAGGSIVFDTVERQQGYELTTENLQRAEDHVRQLRTEVSALQQLQLQAGTDIIAIAANIRAGSEANLQAGGNILLLAAEETDHYEDHRQREDSIGREKSHDMVHDESMLVGTTLMVGNPGAVTTIVDPARLTLNAGSDIALYASQAAATGQVDVRAGGDLSVIAGVNTISHSEQSSKEGLATFKNNQQGFVAQEAVASAISAGGDLNLNAANDVRLTASVLQSGQTLRIGDDVVDPSALSGSGMAPPANVTVDTLTLTNESWNETQKGFRGPVKELVKAFSMVFTPLVQVLSVGLVKPPEIEIASHSKVRTRDVLESGSALQAEALSIAANDTVTLINADVAVADTASITAGDIMIGAIAETHTVMRDEGHETVKGLGAKLGKDEVRVAGVEVTKQSRKDTETLVEWNGTTIDAGELVLNAQRNLAVLGAALNVEGDAVLSAGNELLVGGNEGGLTREHKDVTDVTTVAASIRNAYLDAALTVKAMAEAAEAIKAAKRALADAEDKAGRGELDPDDVKYFRMNLAAATANLVQMEIAMAAALAMGAAAAGTGFYVSGSAVHDKTVTTSTTTQGEWQGSTLSVGGNAALMAGEKIKVQGSDVSVGNTLTVDARKIVLVAGEEHSSSKSKTTQEHEGFSISSKGGSVNAGLHQTDADSQGTHYVNTHLNAGTLASTSDSLQLAGAVIEADQVGIRTGALSVVSLQDTYQSKSKTVGGNVGISGGQGGVTGASIAADFQKSETERRWVAEQSGIIGHDTIRITADDTLLTGAVVANAARDENGNLVDQGKLQLKTNTLVVNNLYDVDRTKTIGANLAVGVNIGSGTKVQGTQTNAPAGNTSTGAAAAASKGGVPLNSITAGGLYNGHVTERTTFATLGMGQVEVGGELLTEESGLVVNRDVANAQVITKDQDIGGLNASVTVDGRWFSKDGREEMAQQQKTVGTNMQAVVRGLGSEIDTGINLGASMAGVENPAATTEKIVDMIGSFGLIPTKLNNGGLLAQLPGQFLPGSDANQRQMVAASADSPYVLANPEMGWIPITETSGYHLLSPAQQERLKDVVVSNNPIAIAAGTATYQNSTNGMLNTPALAMYNAVTQTHDMVSDPSQSVLVTLNYNPTRGVIADGLESFQDKLAIDLGQNWMATNVAVDTGIFVNQVMLARGDEQANFANHSQGNLLNFSGLLAVGLDEAIEFGPEGDRNFTWNMFGSPANAKEFDGYLYDKNMLLSSSSVNDGDFVGQTLGGNYGLFVAGKEGTQFLRVESISADAGVRYQLSNAVTLEQTKESNSSGSVSPILDLLRLFGLGGDSTHSNYSCVVNCGAESMRSTRSTATSEKSP